MRVNDMMKSEFAISPPYLQQPRLFVFASRLKLRLH